VTANLDHVSINISNARVCFPFYKKLLEFLGYQIVKETANSIGFRREGADIWLSETENSYKKEGFNRRRTGLNHLAFRVGSQEEVDRFNNEFLRPNGIFTLYGTPKAFPKYTGKYYAVFFEDPDRVKLEVMTR